jgi:hypothetical protein
MFENLCQAKQILCDAASDIRQPALDRLISSMLANGTNSQKRTLYGDFR